MNFQDLISNRARVIEASGIRKIFDLAATLKDPINLSIGQPDFDVPEEIKQEAIVAIQEGYNRYTPSGGIPLLKNSVSDRFLANHGTRPEDVLITCGVSGGLTLALMALVNAGDEVLVPDPYFVSYKHLTTLCGGKSVFYDTYPDFRIRVDALEGQVTDRTKVILAMSPGNPTGECIDDETKQALADLARRKNLIIISDEIYELFTYDKPVDRSLASWYPEGTIALGGLSKTSAMTGWRIGWALGPKALIQEMTKLQQFTFVCAPSFAQKAALKAFNIDLSDTVAAYRWKRDFMVAGLKAAGYEIQAPGGGFYLMVKVPDCYPNGQAIVEAASKRNLLIVPGHAFSERDTHFRISYGASNDQLKAGLEVLESLNP